MHRIDCPWCGPRDEAEFQYQGDATKVRPAPDAPVQAFYDYVYTRDNPKGWHLEWWHHVGGCRQWVKVVRHTVTHEIRATGHATDRLDLPDGDSGAGRGHDGGARAANPREDGSGPGEPGDAADAGDAG